MKYFWSQICTFQAELYSIYMVVKRGCKVFSNYYRIILNFKRSCQTFSKLQISDHLILTATQLQWLMHGWIISSLWWEGINVLVNCLGCVWGKWMKIWTWFAYYLESIWTPSRFYLPYGLGVDRSMETMGSCMKLMNENHKRKDSYVKVHYLVPNWYE